MSGQPWYSVLLGWVPMVLLLVVALGYLRAWSLDQAARDKGRGGGAGE